MADDAVTEKEFGDFRSQFEAMQEDKSRLRLLKAWLSDHKLSCAQAAELLQIMFGVGDIGVQAAILMHPQLTDPDQTEAVLVAAFKFPEEKDE
eukprot:gene18359-4667_t